MRSKLSVLILIFIFVLLTSTLYAEDLTSTNKFEGTAAEIFVEKKSSEALNYNDTGSAALEVCLRSRSNSIDPSIEVDPRCAALIAAAELAGSLPIIESGKYYGGAGISDVVQAYTDDANVHTDHRYFGACHQYIVEPLGCSVVPPLDRVIYNWPVVSVSIGNFSETKHFTNNLYLDYNQGLKGNFELEHYARAQGYAAGATGGLPVNLNLASLPREAKRLHGAQGGVKQVAYHLTPTLLQMAYSSVDIAGAARDLTSLLSEGISPYSSYHLKTLAYEYYIAHRLDVFCGLDMTGVGHPKLIPPELVSDITMYAEMATNSGWSEQNFPNEMSSLRSNPAMCLQENLGASGSTTNMLQPLADSISGIGGGFIPALPSQYSKCITNLGRTKPVTTFSQDLTSDVPLSQVMLFKAIDTELRLSELGQLGTVVNYLDLLRTINPLPGDQLQIVYPKGKVDPTNPVGGLNQCFAYTGTATAASKLEELYQRNPIEHPGMVTITLWKKFIGCTLPGEGTVCQATKPR